MHLLVAGTISRARKLPRSNRAAGDFGYHYTGPLAGQIQFLTDRWGQVDHACALQGMAASELGFFARRNFRRCGQVQHDVQDFILPKYPGDHGIAHQAVGDGVAHFRAAQDFRAVQAENDIACLDAGLKGGRWIVDVIDKKTAATFELQDVGHLPGYVLALDAQPGPHNRATAIFERAQGVRNEVGRDGKSDTR